MTLAIWTVYKHPTDYPTSYVARKFRCSQPTDEVIIKPNLKELQDFLKANNRDLVCLQRSPEDDRTIVEIWL